MDALDDARMMLLSFVGPKSWFISRFESSERCGDLLVDGEMPPSVLLFFAHIAGYDVGLQAWDDGDQATMFLLVDYPEAFSDYMGESFAALRETQSQLLAPRKRWARRLRSSRG